MSSTSKTDNLLLNQWAASDMFQHEDFNNDNAILDTAIMNRPHVRLLETTTQVAASQEDIDVSEIDFLQYRRIYIFPEIPTTYATIYLRMRVNDITANDSYRGGSWSIQYGEQNTTQKEDYLADWAIGLNTYSNYIQFGDISPYSVVGCIGFHLMQNGANELYRKAWGCLVPNVGWGDLTKLPFYMSSSSIQVPANSKIVIYGVRK